MDERNRTGVIFDMDGVLINSADAHFRSWQVLAEQEGTSVHRDQFTATFGRRNADIVPLLFGEVDPPQLAALADRKETIYRDLMRDKPPLVRGAANLIAALDDAGVALAIGSSAPRANVDLVLSALGASHAITTIVSAEDVTRGKPDPQVFALAAEALGLSPEQCVVIEDAPVGVMAARKAGTKVVAVLSTHSASSFGQPGSEFAPDAVVDTLSAVTVETLEQLAES